MISWLKKHFIPHQGNEHRPHILRDASTRNIIVLILFLEIFTFLIPILGNLNIPGNMASVLPAVLDDLTNTERQDQNLPTLTISPLLTKAAEMKAQDMATYGYFAHTSPEGKTPWYWLEQVGYQYQYAGENLAINFTDSKDVTNAWMNSPTHRANIAKEQYTEIGTGIATGEYEGKASIFVVQLYANPLSIPLVENSTTISDILVPINPIKISETKPTTMVTKTNQTQTSVLGEEIAAKIVATTQSPNILQKAIASPFNTTNEILLIIFGVMILTLFLYIFMRHKNIHFDLIKNSSVVLAVVLAVVICNYYYSSSKIITESIDYSNVH